MKKNTPQLSRRLTSYSLLAGSVVAMAGTADAQVAYTDIEDVTYTDNNTGAFLDLDNNGQTDFTIALFNFTSNGKSFRKVVGIPATGNSLAGSSLSGYVFPTEFNSGDQICEQAPWHIYTTSSQVFVLASSNNDIGGGNEQFRGDFLGANDNFLGLRFTNDGEEHYYGWARLDVATNAGSFTMKDFAYQLNADTICIAAGDTGSITGVHAIQVSNLINIVVFDRNVFISSPSPGGEDMIINIIDMQGTIVQHIKTREQQYHISLNRLPQGIYIVNVQQGTVMKTRKVSLK